MTQEQIMMTDFGQYVMSGGITIAFLLLVTFVIFCVVASVDMIVDARMRQAEQDFQQSISSRSSSTTTHEEGVQSNS